MIIDALHDRILTHDSLDQGPSCTDNAVLPTKSPALIIQWLRLAEKCFGLTDKGRPNFIQMYDEQLMS